MDLKGSRLAVIGLGVSGVAAARLALAKGADVYVSDSRQDAPVAARGADLRMAGAAVDLGGHDVERVVGADVVVVSPGIPPTAPVLVELAGRGVRWISEPELAARFFTGSLIGITGTNGKTTVTLLVEHFLRVAGIRVAAGGNVGGGLAPAASDLALESDRHDWWVLEMSSFQLSAVDRFRPDIGVVTSLGPDHLDYYDSVEAYYADKARLFDNADDASRWVLPAGNAEVAALAGDAPGRRYGFGGGPESSAYVAAGQMVLEIDGEREILCAVDQLPLIGRHNVENALAAALTARLAGADPGALVGGLRTATPLPHRLQPVRERADVLWVNDSKATNVGATLSALTSLDRPVVLLVGGKDKGESFVELGEALDTRARAALIYGAAGPRILDELTPAAARTALELVDGDLDSVVDRAARVARPGDVVLLSPACSSFDMFESYEHRGRRFVELVEALP